MLTPSLFNDDAMFQVLERAGRDKETCLTTQSPAVRATYYGQDNGNTTNSWLNLGKILELTISDGVHSNGREDLSPTASRTPLKGLRTSESFSSEC